MKSAVVLIIYICTEMWFDLLGRKKQPVRENVFTAGCLHSMAVR